MYVSFYAKWVYALYGHIDRLADSLLVARSIGFKFQIRSIERSTRPQRWCRWCSTYALPKRMDKYKADNTSSSISSRIFRKWQFFHIKSSILHKTFTKKQIERARDGGKSVKVSSRIFVQKPSTHSFQIYIIIRSARLWVFVVSIIIVVWIIFYFTVCWWASVSRRISLVFFNNCSGHSIRRRTWRLMWKVHLWQKN